ncbi:MAG TPA: hypothetical protein VMW91_04740 [Desulfosporosinus sp.]|nr:hypothetical protein [Desulfosporosinus sp.]
MAEFYEFAQVLPGMGKVPGSAVLYDFEEAKTIELDFTVQDGKATVTIPSIYAYSILELR